VRARDARDGSLRERRIAELVEAAIRLFCRHGYAKTPMRDIARAANVSVGTPYTYFPSKESILAEATRAFTDRLAASLREGFAYRAEPEARLRVAFTRLVELVDEASDLHILVYREMPALPAETRRYITERELEMVQAFRRILDDGVERGTFRPHRTELRARTLVFTAHMWALKRWALRGASGPLAFAEEQIDLVLEGIRKGPLSPTRPSPRATRARRSRP